MTKYRDTYRIVKKWYRYTPTLHHAMLHQVSFTLEFDHVPMVYLNPSVTTRVKISQNVDVLTKVYLVHLTLLWLQGSKSVKILIYLPRYLVHWKVKHCQTLCVVHLQVKMSLPFLTIDHWPFLTIVLYCSGWSKWVKNVRVYIWVNSQNSQLNDFNHCSYLPLQFSYSSTVNTFKWHSAVYILICFFP